MSPPGFHVVARTSFSGTFEHCLSFESDEEFQVLRWSKAGWWWAQRPNGEQGWIYSAQMRPKMCSACHDKAQNLPPQPEKSEPEDADAQGTEAEPWPPLPPTQEEVWPPLPSGAPPPRKREDEPSAFDGDYTQTMTFRLDGKVVTEPTNHDRVMRQCDYYFNYQNWIDGQNTAVASKKRPGKTTGDGGFKRRR
ncbi:unnamed protein product [Effrenium voratum]|nr:unnamed protein product [Effrenium voratum]